MLRRSLSIILVSSLVQATGGRWLSALDVRSPPLDSTQQHSVCRRHHGNVMEIEFWFAN